MRRPRLALALAALLAAAAPAAAQVAKDCTPGRAAAGTRVLVFSRTTGYRHASIAIGKPAIVALGARHGFAVDTTEDPTRFTDAGLKPYRAVVFLSTTGDVLDAAQQAAFERFIARGGGYAGVHAAADTEYDWPWYGTLVGAYFKHHPAIQQASIDVRDRRHPSTRCLAPRWTRTDEWYDYRALPPADVTVLATLDESSYKDGEMGASHPITWYHRVGQGRAWYTGLGHTDESYSEPAFLDLLAGGILWAAGSAR